MRTTAQPLPDNPITSTQIRASAAIVGAQRQNLGCVALPDAVVAALRRLRGEGLGFKKMQVATGVPAATMLNEITFTISSIIKALG